MSILRELNLNFLADKLDHARATTIHHGEKQRQLLPKQRKARHFLTKRIWDMDQSVDDSPLIINREGEIDNDFIKEFMTSHMQFKKVPRENAEIYLSTLNLENVNITDNDVDEEGNVSVIVNQSYLQFSGT